MAAFALASLGRAKAEEAGRSLSEWLDLSGSLRAAYWSSDRTLDDRLSLTPAGVWLKAEPDFGGGFGARAEGWVIDEVPLRGRAPKGELREALVAWHGEGLDFSLGRRLVTWGRADRINATDVVVSRDYTLLFTDDDDQKRGSFMAVAAYGISDLTLTAYWLPEYRPNIYPVPHPRGLRVHQPRGGFAADQAALRIDQTGGGFDWSLSYFDGIGRDPDARVAQLDATGLSVRVVHHRERAFGADFATNAGAYGLRGELAYVRPEPGGNGDLFDRGRYVSLVLGADHNLTEHLGVNAQYLFHYVTDGPHVRRKEAALEPIAVRAALLNNQLTRTQQGATFRIAYTGLHDALTAELAGAGYFTDGSAAVRPKLAYSVNDRVKIIVGADIFFGEQDSYYGQIKDNRAGYAEFRYSF